MWRQGRRVSVAPGNCELDLPPHGSAPTEWPQSRAWQGPRLQGDETDGWIPATWGFDHQKHPKTIGFNVGSKFSRKWWGDQSSFWQKWTGLQSIPSSFYHWSFNGSNPSDNKLFRSCQSYSQKPHCYCCYWFPAYSKVFALGEWKPPQHKVWLETDSPISKFFLLESLKGADIEDGNI